MHSRLPVSASVIQAALVTLGLLTLLFIWGHYFMAAQRTRDDAVAAKIAEHRNLSVIVAESLVQMGDRARALGLSILQSTPLEDAPGRELSHLLASDPVFDRLTVFSHGGERLFASHHAQAGPLDARHIAQADARSASFGSLPFVPLTLPSSEDRPPTPVWRLPFLFPLNAPDSRAERFLVLVELDLGHLARLYQNLELGRSGFIQVLDADGHEHMRADSGGVLFATSTLHPDTPPDRAALSGSFASMLSEKAHQSVFRHVPEHGFSVVISQSRAEILEPTEQTIARMRWINLVTSALLIGAVVWLLSMLHGQKHSLQALQTSEFLNRQLIERLRREHARSRHEAAVDHLSGLFNRRQCIEVAQQILEAQSARRQLFAVLFIDLDRFKSINDTLGHRVGNLLLQAVAGRIRNQLQDADQAARFGGDEFVVLLAGERSEQQIDLWVVRLIERLSATYELDGIELNTSPSVGIAIYPRDAQNVDGLLRCADAAMYSAKRIGHGKHRYYDPSLNPVDVEAFQLEQSLGDALRRHEFVLHYQPQLRLSGSQVVGYEALVRWQHPQFGLLYPDRFIGLAEVSGFIVQLGQEVLELACRQCAQWRDAGLETCIAVNASALQLTQEGFAGQVLQTLARAGLSVGNIELEITETAILQHDPRTLANLRQLRAAGIGISLDDFGKGYAGFAHLQALPLTKLKIDRSLIAQISTQQDETAIVTSTIALAHKLKLLVVAEGVETQEQLVHLRLASCDIVQGYHISPPLPARDVADFQLRLSRDLTRNSS